MAPKRKLHQIVSNLRFSQKRIIVIAVLFSIIGAIALIRSFAAINGVVPFEGEGTTPAGDARVVSGDSSASGGGYIEFGLASTNPNPNPPPAGTIVPLPGSHPTGSLTSTSTGGLWGMASCATEDPICIFTHQTEDMYSGRRGGGSYCGCGEIWNVQTKTLIKRFNFMDAAGLPDDGNRPYAIFNPLKKEWLVVTQSTRRNWSGGGDQLSRPYGQLVSINGDLIGTSIELSRLGPDGWVPHGVFDTVNKKYFVQWHQRTFDDSYDQKDMHATVVDEDGTVTDMDFNIQATPPILDEYGSVVYNTKSGEIVTVVSADFDGAPSDYTSNLDTQRLKIDTNGKLSKIGGPTRIDDDNNVEWGLQAAYNPVTDSIVITYRTGTSARNAGGLTNAHTRVLDGAGKPKASEKQIGSGLPDSGGAGYWTTGTTCSTQTNVCIAMYGGQATYVDANSTGTTATSAIGASGAQAFSWFSTRAAYSPITDKFYIHGSGGFVTAPGR